MNGQIDLSKPSFMLPLSDERVFEQYAILLEIPCEIYIDSDAVGNRHQFIGKGEVW